MPKQSQLDRAIAALVAKQADIAAKAHADCAALESAILTLKTLKVVRKLKQPRAVQHGVTEAAQKRAQAS